MSGLKTILAVAAGAAVTVPLVGAPIFKPGTVAGTYVGRGSSETPYAVPTAPGWSVISLLTTADKHGNYRMAGTPDGLGALAGRIDAAGDVVADPAQMTVVVNHEFGSGDGAIRAHGARGAFVSQWTFNVNTLALTGGQDLIEEIYTYNSGSDTYSLATLAQSALNRLCSADLPAMTAFYNPATGKGFPGRIFTSGEESTPEGRSFAHILTGAEKGRSYQLAYLGRFAWENIVAHPSAGDKTVVVGLDDATPGQLYVYVGDKRASGNPVERAGLHGGKLFGIKVTNGGANYGNAATALENKGAINGAFSLVDVSTSARGTGAALDAASDALGITEFARPEDGHWDPTNPNVFYFVTTGALGQDSRLYKLTFNSITNPTGGTIQLVVGASSLTGTDGQAARTFDNMTVDQDGHVLIQEDPGGSSYIAKTWRLDPAAPLAAVQIAESDRARFLPGGLTTNEESSGIIEVTDIMRNANWYEPGRRYYLADMQAHYDLPGPFVEGGQIYMIVSPPNP